MSGEHIIINIPAKKLSGLLQAQANRGRCPALRAIRSAAAGTKYRHQRFGCLAAHRAIGFDRPEVRRRGIASIALIAFRALLSRSALLAGSALWSLRPLSSGLTLGARYALHALCTLRTRGTLGPRVTFGTWVFAARGERNRNADQ